LRKIRRKRRHRTSRFTSQSRSFLRRKKPPREGFKLMAVIMPTTILRASLLSPFLEKKKEKMRPRKTPRPHRRNTPISHTPFTTLGPHVDTADVAAPNPDRCRRESATVANA